MRKDQLVESIRNLVLKQSATNDSLKSVHPLYIESEVSKAYDTVVKQFYENDQRLAETELAFFSKKYTLILADESYTETNFVGETSTAYTGRRYVTLPVKPIELKRNLGIRYVKPYYGDISFIRSSENELETIRDLDVYCCMLKAFYYLDGERLMFESGTDEFELVEKVHISMVVPFDSYTDTDDIEVPGGDNAVVQMVLQFMGIRPTDNTNDDVR